MDLAPERSILSLAVQNASSSDAVGSLVVTVPIGFEDRTGELPSNGKQVIVVPGGETRHDSVAAALRTLPDDMTGIILVHDAARPFASGELFDEVAMALGEADAVIPVVPVSDTVKQVAEGAVAQTVPREALHLAQTPQGFRVEVLRHAHERAAGVGRDFTDDAALVEWAGYKVRVVQGEEGNFKITTAEDLERARAKLAGARG
jgi:2-C-methyl-D-erythritol 4-phosphate cytidylyltransferase/2-C-methyl-D-erythritol 2,4-cyclodiphosphate synthase